MNKAELIDRIAAKLNLTKAQVESTLDAMEELIIAALKEGGEVTLTGFGAFSARRRSARMGVNPRNPSERIQMPEVVVPKFRAGKTFKDALKHALPSRTEKP